ncbi:MAG: hypothetical protein E6Q97_02380 [Desulfurellales bacterium]|nr:MAG: hypothetical protein E6Q97_02380 [Desulfurellales bacterium]
MKKLESDDPKVAKIAALAMMLVGAAKKTDALGMSAQAKSILTIIDEIGVGLPDEMLADLRKATAAMRMDVDKRKARLN